MAQTESGLFRSLHGRSGITENEREDELYMKRQGFYAESELILCMPVYEQKKVRVHLLLNISILKLLPKLTTVKIFKETFKRPNSFQS